MSLFCNTKSSFILENCDLICVGTELHLCVRILGYFPSFLKVKIDSVYPLKLLTMEGITFQTMGNI
jgi:hypothetical protein